MHRQAGASSYPEGHLADHFSSRYSYNISLSFEVKWGFRRLSPMMSLLRLDDLFHTIRSEEKNLMAFEMKGEPRLAFSSQEFDRLVGQTQFQ